LRPAHAPARPSPDNCVLGKTAKALDLTVSNQMQLLADEVIEYAAAHEAGSGTVRRLAVVTVPLAPMALCRYLPARSK
jgi:hypothetical protein